MNIEVIDFHLELIHPFRISDYTRTNTPIVFLILKSDNHFGIGECSMPPYLGESIESSRKFINKVDLQKIKVNALDDSLKYIDSVGVGNNGIKAAFDIALHDLYCKHQNINLKSYFNANELLMPDTSFTLGIDKLDQLKIKLKETDRFNRIKIKLGTENDKEIVKTIRRYTQKEILVDANRAWKDKYKALEMIDWLSKQNCLLVEQPMPTDSIEEMIWLKDRSALPLFADESCKRLNDMEGIHEQFHGVNIKLMKSTGLSEAYQMINKAQSLSMKTMIGCMSESSVGILAAASLAPFCDYADLDSVFMVKNNPFKRPELVEGKLKLSDEIGIGYQIENNIFNI